MTAKGLDGDEAPPHAGLAGLLDLVQAGPDRYLAPGGEGVLGLPLVPGTQLLGQSLVAAQRALGDRPVTSMHCVFSRPVALVDPLPLDVEVVAAGRSAGSAVVRVRQDGRTCTTATVLALAPQDVAPHHAPPASLPVPPPAGLPETVRAPGVRLRSVDAVDVLDPEVVAPSRLRVWVSAPGLPAPLGAAALAWSSETLLMGAALLPHAGWSVAQAGTRFAAQVVSHSLWFHAPVPADQWWLFDLHGVALDRGRVFGRADVLAEDGRLLATVAQEGLIRPLPAPEEGRPRD